VIKEINTPKKKRLSNKTFINKLMKDPKFKTEFDALAPEFDLLEKCLIFLIFSEGRHRD